MIDGGLSAVTGEDKGGAWRQSFERTVLQATFRLPLPSEEVSVKD